MVVAGGQPTMRPSGSSSRSPQQEAEVAVKGGGGAKGGWGEEGLSYRPPLDIICKQWGKHPLRLPGAWLGLQLARATPNFAEPANQLRLLLLRYRQRCMGTAAGYGPWPRYDQSKVLVPKTARCPCLHSVSPPWMA